MRTLILSLNPAIDLEWEVERVHWDEKNLIRAERRWAGGKGVNVARWLRFLGGKPLLVAPLGGQSGAELRRHFRQEKLPLRAVPLRQDNRVDVIVTTRGGRQLRFNPAGPLLSDAEWRAIRVRVETELSQSSTLVLSGSLPRGGNAQVYADFIRQAHRHKVRCLLDCDGTVFAEGVKAKPFLVKPNEHELGQWSGQNLKSEQALRKAARALAQATDGWVLVSRGARPAWLINAREAQSFSARPPRLEIRNTVGAGDAMLAAVAWQIECGATPAEWLRWSIVAGTAATQYPAGELPAKAMVSELAGAIAITN